MKMTTYKTDTYDISEIKKGYLLDIVTTTEGYEAWIYHQDYGIKQLMYGYSFEHETYESFVEFVKKGDVRWYIDYYEHEYLG